MGVRPGDVVAIRLPSGADFAAAYAAIAWVGGVVTALNPRLGPREVAAVLDRAAPVLVVTTELIDEVDWTSGTTGVPKGA